WHIRSFYTVDSSAPLYVVRRLDGNVDQICPTEKRRITIAPAVDRGDSNIYRKKPQVNRWSPPQTMQPVCRNGRRICDPAPEAGHNWCKNWRPRLWAAIRPAPV